MRAHCYKFFIFLSIFLLNILCADSEPTPISVVLAFILYRVSEVCLQGPFRSMITSVEDCSRPSRPYMKNPPIDIQASVYNVTGKVNKLSGNITVEKDVSNVKSKIKSFLWRDGKWELNYLMNNLDCHGMLLHLICAATKVKYDRKKCMYVKGSYSYKNLDVNQMQHLWASTMEYGLLMWRVEMFIPAGTITCKDFVTMTEPA